MFFFFFLNFPSHSYVFFLVYPWGGDYFIEDPRGRFCQHYTEVSIIIVYCETRNCKNRIHVFYVGYSRSPRVFNFIGALRLDDSGYQLNQERPSMQYLSCSRNRYGTYIKSRSFHSTSLAHRLSGTQHMYPTPRGGTRENGRKNRWPLQPPACHLHRFLLSTERFNYQNQIRFQNQVISKLEVVRQDKRRKGGLKWWDGAVVMVIFRATLQRSHSLILSHS